MTSQNMIDIGSGYGLWNVLCQDIIWTNSDILSTGLIET